MVDMTTRSASIKHRLKVTPVIGYVVSLLWAFFKLPSKLQRLEGSINGFGDSTTQNLNVLKARIEKFEESAKQSEKSQANISNQLADIKHQLLLRPVEYTGQNVKDSKSSGELLANNHHIDKFYIDFENKFRGTEEEIYERLMVYVPHLKNTPVNFGRYPALDIGCGRGEMLKIMTDNHIKCVGIDLNKSMIEHAIASGYEAKQVDALEYLMTLKSSSIGAITGIHIVEHIPFDVLLTIFQECYRVLRPGGIMIFETPNPESIHVGSFSFYFDPSHLHPIPPDILAFSAENRGFDKVDILRLHPMRSDYNKLPGKYDARLVEIVNRFYGPQDYSIVAQKL